MIIRNAQTEQILENTKTFRANSWIGWIFAYIILIIGDVLLGVGLYLILNNGRVNGNDSDLAWKLPILMIGVLIRGGWLLFSWWWMMMNALRRKWTNKKGPLYSILSIFLPEVFLIPFIVIRKKEGLNKFDLSARYYVDNDKSIRVGNGVGNAGSIYSVDTELPNNSNYDIESKLRELKSLKDQGLIIIID